MAGLTEEQRKDMITVDVIKVQAIKIRDLKAMLDNALAAAENLSGLADKFKDFIEVQRTSAEAILETRSVKNCESLAFFRVNRFVETFVADAAQVLKRIEPNPPAGPGPKTGTAAAARTD